MNCDTVDARPRIHELDAVRGMALCGILVVDIQQITGLSGTIGVALTLDDGLGLVLGLFLLGLAADRFGIADILRDRGWQIAVVFAIALPAAVVAAVWQYRTPYLELWTSVAAPVAGLL